MTGRGESGARRRTPQRAWEEVFIDSLAQGATITAAAIVAGVSRRTVYDAKERDGEFAARWTDAYEQGTDLLEQEARRRAAEGTEKPLLYKGQVVATVREYSDTLMLALLKARRPADYRERYEIDGPGLEITVIDSRLPHERGEVIEGEVEPPALLEDGQDS